LRDPVGRQIESGQLLSRRAEVRRETRQDESLEHLADGAKVGNWSVAGRICSIESVLLSHPVSGWEVSMMECEVRKVRDDVREHIEARLQEQRGHDIKRRRLRRHRLQ
jgi:hypothetical protein